MGKLVVKRICALLLVFALVVGYLGVFSLTTAEASTVNTTTFPNRTPDQARRDIADAVGMNEYLNATISTLHDFHYGDILQLTAAVFIFDGDENHGKQRFLDNWVEMYQPFYDRIPFIVNFAHVFYFPERVVGAGFGGAAHISDNASWFLGQLAQLPNSNAIDTIILMDSTRGSEPNIVELDGKTHYFIHAALGGANSFTLHGAIHGFHQRLIDTTRTTVNPAWLTGFRQTNRDAAEWRQRYPELPHYSQWDAGTLHTLSRNVILGLPSEVGMPTTRQSWSGGNPDHGWADFRIGTYFEATTQAELDATLNYAILTQPHPLTFAHYFIGPTTMAEWDIAHTAVVTAGGNRAVLEYMHYLRWAQTSPKSITQAIDPQGNQVGFDVALAKYLRNMVLWILPDGTSLHDLPQSQRTQLTFHQLPVRGAGTSTNPNPNPTSTPPPANEQPSSWARTNIARAEEMGLLAPEFLSGFSRTTTRAEFTALAVALYEHYTGTTITGRERFDDTTDVNVEKAAYLGIVSGVGNNRFNPDGQLTREMAAVMLARLANVIGQPLPASAPTFADNAQLSSWASDGVGRVQAVGIMGGVGNNIFAPRNPYTIEQSIVSMMRLYDLLD